MVYEYLKRLYPFPAYRKIRREGSSLIAMNEALEISYFNETSAFFIENVNGQKSVDEIASNIEELYEVERHVLENDLCNLVRELQWNELIYLANEPQKA